MEIASPALVCEHARMRLGIDFGTTHTIVTCADRGNYPVVSFQDADGDAVDWFPSVVAERDGELRFGFAAQAVAGEDGWTPLRSFKRLLGAPGAHEAEVAIGGTRLAAGELTTRFLAALRQALEGASNATVDGPLEAAVAVPANAHGAQRFLTLDAFRRAGFEVLALLNEPSAAGFEYTHRYRDTLSARRDQILVYDLGGGTFDASLVRMTGRRHEVLATAGLPRLGGDDFDEALADLVLARAGGGEKSARLLARCRDAKERLGPQTRKISVELDGGEAVVVPVADYYAACQPLVDRTLEALASIHRDDVAGIYVVGGASALPPVGRTLRERHGRRVHRSPYPFAAVAIGLAISADEGAGFVLEDRLSRHMGVFREEDAGRSVAFDAIFTAEAAHGEELLRVYRAAHNLGHYRFVECSDVEGGVPRGDITPLGDVLFPFDPELRGATLEGAPVRRLARPGPLVEERYAIDAGGLVRVTITDLDTGYRQEHCLGA
jgi:molecular chaperone DnaK (HSP70)